MLQGVDVHAGYGAVDHEKLSKVVRFCYAKMTEGNENYVDPQYAANVAGCRKYGTPIGCYHFAEPLPIDELNHPGRSPKDQARRAFAACLGVGTKDGDLPHVIDAEWPSPGDLAKWGCTAQQISDWLREYCEEATILWGRKPVIYTYPSWWRWLAANADVSWARAYLLFFADYGHSGPGTPPDGWRDPHESWVAGTWSEWAICQYSAEGSGERLDGINACPIDRDCIRDEETLAKLLRVSAAVPEQLDEAPIIHPNPMPDEIP